jgi:hypothetical protein
MSWNSAFGCAWNRSAVIGKRVGGLQDCSSLIDSGAG